MKKIEEFDFFQVEELEERLEMNAAADNPELFAEGGVNSDGPYVKGGVKWAL